MALLSRVGRLASNFKTIEKASTAGVLGAGTIALLAGINSQDPMKPYTDLLQEEVTGDPQGFKKIAGAYISTYWDDSFRGTAAQNNINQLRTPSGRPRFSAPGDIVLGMYNSRHG